MTINLIFLIFIPIQVLKELFSKNHIKIRNIDNILTIETLEQACKLNVFFLFKKKRRRENLIFFF